MRPRFQISAAGSLIVILIAALGFAAVGTDSSNVKAPPTVVYDLPSSLSARVAAAGFSAVLNPEILQSDVQQEEEVVLAAVDPAPAPRAEPTPATVSTTTAPPATTTTAPPATTTTTAPPATTTTTAPAATTTTTTAPPATTTTTAATATTTTVPPVEGGSRNVEEWRSLVAQYFPSELVDEALVVMRCESLGDPLAYNSRSGASGLFQFIPGTWGWASPEAGFSGASPFEPEANTATAAWLVQTSLNQGKDAWTHWSCKP